MNETNDGQDLVGIGKVAEAIPDEVYTQTSSAVVDTFYKLTSPITETTDGLGRYIKQKFDNMVDAEKALASYSIQNAIEKAERKSERKGLKLISPPHAKSFVKSIEEASKEIDPTLHAMWENLIADQLTNVNSHPHFVEILSHFSPREANVLLNLKSNDEIGENGGNYIAYNVDNFKNWISSSHDDQLKPWTLSCTLLMEFRFAEVAATKEDVFDKDDAVTILYRTKAGEEFLSAVTSELA